MFSNKKYTLVALAALGASGPEVRALSHKAGNQWHLAMVPDTFPENSFISQPGRDMGFGVGEPLGFNFGGDFGFGSGFSDFPKPHLDSFSDDMQDMMQHAGEGTAPGKGQSFSSSSSSSYSSAIGADGKKHEKSSKSGQQEVCKDGQCKIVQCDNGKCKELVGKASGDVHQSPSNPADSRVAVDQQVVPSRPALSAVEQSLKKNFERMDKSMGQHMRQMQEGIQQDEKAMVESFRDLPTKMEQMAADGGDEQAQTFSSSVQQALDNDGKLHKQESRRGSATICKEGGCREITCNNGRCQERSIGEKAGKDTRNGRETRALHHHRRSHRDEGSEPKEGRQVITKEQFKELLKKLKERVAMEHPGEKPKDVEVRIAPTDGQKGADQQPPRQQANVPVPPPAFAPKNK